MSLLCPTTIFFPLHTLSENTFTLSKLQAILTLHNTVLMEDSCLPKPGKAKNARIEKPKELYLCSLYLLMFTTFDI